MFHSVKFPSRPSAEKETNEGIGDTPTPAMGLRPLDPLNNARLNRRQLLKLGAAGSTMVAASSLAARAAVADELIRGGKSISRTTGFYRRPVASTCTHCSARCGIIAFTEEDRIVKIEGNPRDPNNRGRLCARGQAGINRVYDPDRVLFPMERVGKRGEGKWVRLSWEQAYDTLQERLSAQQSVDPESLVLHVGEEARPLLAGRFVAAFGSRALVDEGVLRNASRETANKLTMGVADEVVDVVHARYILNFGGNPYETHPAYVPFVQRLVDARMSGARLVTFDPRMSLTAGRSDEWYPVAPGSDASIALAMANVIVQQDLHDREFLSRWTDLSGDQLARQLAEYTPEAAEQASGMRADDLRRTATEFARVRPAVAIFGGGLTHQRDGIDAQRAVMLLNAIVGSMGAQGGYCPASTTAFVEPEPLPAGKPDPLASSTMVDNLLQGKRQVGIYVTALANPAYSWPNSSAFKAALGDENRVAYLVSIDTDLTETSSLADLVLPAATYLESWGLESPPSQELVSCVSLRQPAIQARGEALSVDDILLTLGTRLTEDSSRYFPFPSVESYVDAVVSKIPGLAGAGGLNLLKEQGRWSDSSAPRHRPESSRFATSSGKLEFGSVISGGVAAAGTAAVIATGTGHQDTAELTLVTYRPNVYSGDYSANCWWLAEITHSNPLLISPAAAQRRGIKQGQRVKVISQVGSVEARVRITQAIHPQVVALAMGFGHEALGRVARGKRFKSSDPMTMEIWWEKQGNGVNASALIPNDTAEKGRGLAWTNTKVRVEALG